MSSKARFQNPRIKAMLERCSYGSQSDLHSNKENHSTSHRTQSSAEVCKENISYGYSTKHLAKNVTSEELVNSLHAVEYSMMSSVFQTFDETKTTWDSEKNFSDLITKISAGLPSMSKETSLICTEIMPPSSPCCSMEVNISNPNNDLNPMLSAIRSEAEDFSSDDSVKDKNYYPSDESSTDDDDDENQSSAGQKLRLIDDAGNVEPRQGNIFNLEPLQENSLNLEPLQERSLNLEPLQENSSLLAEAGSFLSASATAVNNSNNENGISARERNLKKKKEKLLSYNVKVGCDDEKCLKKCSSKLPSDRRTAINKEYWALTWKERRLFVRNSTAVAIPKRKTTSEPKRAPRSTFYLKNDNGANEEVCKTFFLTTLGFHKNNDTVLYNSLHKNLVDKRGLHTKTAPYDRKLLIDHVESFHPLEPHYRREHAPLRRYISCDVTVTLMHKDFCEKYPSQKVSYELYRKHLKSMNISFAKLGNEECELCEAYELHAKNTHHDAKNVVPENCEICTAYVCHREKYKKARDLYEAQKKIGQTLENIHYSVDLQKVIMLPRLDNFKSIIFCPRLTTFNLTFAPVGKITNQHKPLACIWHDGISGRKQEDIMSCYYHFIIQFRDVKNITIWMDNCSAQNKNWLLFSLMIYLINSDLIATETITLQYFEPGHSFMSCDQFHHQVELAMKRKGKLYDFQDFTECVASANQARVDVKSMASKDFFTFQNFVSDRRIQSSTPRVYLKDIIQVCFQRNNHDMLYKTEVDMDDYKVLRFLTDRYLKNTDVLKPEFKSSPKGIEKTRKFAIINALKDISAPHKMQFWHEMPECN